MSSATNSNPSVSNGHSNSFPRRVKIKTVTRSRYDSLGDDRFQSGNKPLSWDRRRAGVDEVITETGETLKLFSNGGQSTPAPGWELVLTGYAGEIEIAAAPAPADPLVIQRLSTKPRFGDAAATHAIHTDGVTSKGSADSERPIVWTLYGIAKTA